MSFPNMGDTPPGNRDYHQQGAKEPPPTRHKHLERYAEPKDVKKKLNKVKDDLHEVRDLCERELEKQVLEVVDDDDELLTAINREWPEEIDKEPPDRVSYRFYRTLRHRTTTSSKLIRRRFEKAARGVKGAPELDVLKLSDFILKEVQNLENTLLPELYNLYDAGENRVIENTFDWAVSAHEHARGLHRILAKKGESDYTPDQIGRIGERDARKGQAVFKVKFNSVTNKLKKEIEALQGQWAEQSEDFYKKVLIPAMKFHMEVSRGTFESENPFLQEIKDATDSLDIDFSRIITDQVRRTRLFHTHMETAYKELRNRERYRQNIIDLSGRGGKVPADGLTELEDPPDEHEFWERHDQRDKDELLYTPGARRPAEMITTDHSALQGIEEHDAHEQYLLRYGDKLIGDLDVEDGILIDGVNISEHRHTGEDGSEQISGEDILGGTIGDDKVDPDDVPPVPTDLEVKEFKETTVEPGYTMIDVVVEFQGREEHMYEVEIAKIGVPLGVN